jgi:hypothetical protein
MFHVKHVGGIVGDRVAPELQSPAPAPVQCRAQAGSASRAGPAQRSMAVPSPTTRPRARPSPAESCASDVEYIVRGEILPIHA